MILKEEWLTQPSTVDFFISIDLDPGQELVFPYAFIWWPLGYGLGNS